PVELQFGEVSEYLSASSVPMSSKDEGPFQTFAHGGFFGSEMENACLLSVDLAKRLTERDPATLIGLTPTLSYAASSSGALPQAPAAPFQIQRKDALFRIVGILERDPASGAGGGALLSGLMIPLGKATEM